MPCRCPLPLLGALFLPGLAHSAPQSTTVVGSAAWRAPADIDTLDVHGDTIWVSAANEVLAFDPAGTVVHRFAACPEEGGLYPFGTISVSPGGDRMAISCGDVRVVGLPHGKELWKTTSQTGSPSFAWSADGRELVMVTETVTPRNTVGPWALRVYDADGGALQRDLPEQYLYVADIPEGYVAATWDESHLVALGPDLRERWRASRTVDESGVHLVAGQVCLSSQHTIRCWDRRTGTLTATFEPPMQPGEDWRYQLDMGKVEVVGDAIWLSWDDEVQVWHPGRGLTPLAHQPPGEIWTAHGDGALDWVYSPRLTRIAASGARVEPTEEWSKARAVALDHDGSHVALVDPDNRLFAGPAKGPVTLLGLAVSPDRLLRMSAQGTHLLVEPLGDAGPHIVEVSADTHRPLLLDGEPVDYASGAFAPDGTLWVVGQHRHSDLSQLGTVDLATGVLSARHELDRTFDVHWIDPTGRYARVSWDESNWMLDLESGEREHYVYLDDEHDCGVTMDNGKPVLCTGDDEAIFLEGGPRISGDLMLGPPGTPYVSSELDDARVRFWRLGDHAPVGQIELRMEGAPVWSGDGQHVALRSRDGRIHVVHLPRAAAR